MAVIGGGVALGTSLSAQPEPSPAPKAATVPSQLSAHFAALATRAGADSAGIASASSETRSHLEGSDKGLGAQFGLNPSLAKRVTYGDAHLWVEPGSAGLCVMDYEAGAGSCGSIAEALEGSIAVGVGSAGSTVVYGLVPNGNSQVAVHDADGTTEDVPVENNVYIISHPGAVSAEVIDGGGQPTTVELPK